MARGSQFRIIRKKILKALVPLLYGAHAPNHRNTKLDAVLAPKRILLLNGAHIGDVVVATSVLPILRSAYPSTEIGFATGSWAQMVVAKHPQVAYTHCVDHWRHNRSTDTLYRKMLRYKTSRQVALKEIRELQYDIALSLYTQFPDLLDISWAARIPVRIGFRSSFFSSLATHLIDQPENPLIHQGVRLAELLHALPIDPVHFQFRQSTLPASDTSSIQEVCTVLRVSSLEDIGYRVIHMGSGEVRREFPRSFWRELAERLSREHALLFTGRGKREEENIASVIRGLDNCINACDRLTWNGFVAAVRHAEVLYGVESMAGHVAAAVGTKCIVVYGGAAGVARWRPEGRNSLVFTNHLPCAPCLQAFGCADMTCMKNISPSELIRLGH